MRVCVCSCGSHPPLPSIFFHYHLTNTPPPETSFSVLWCHLPICRGKPVSENLTGRCPPCSIMGRLFFLLLVTLEDISTILIHFSAFISSTIFRRYFRDVFDGEGQWDDHFPAISYSSFTCLILLFRRRLPAAG